MIRARKSYKRLACDARAGFRVAGMAETSSKSAEKEQRVCFPLCVRRIDIDALLAARILLLRPPSLQYESVER